MYTRVFVQAPTLIPVLLTLFTGTSQLQTMLNVYVGIQTKANGSTHVCMHVHCTHVHVQDKLCVFPADEG